MRRLYVYANKLPGNDFLATDVLRNGRQTRKQESTRVYFNIAEIIRPGTPGM